MPPKRPVNSWVDRTLSKLTPHQRGFFLKNRLMPFTTAKEISARAKVPPWVATMLLRQLAPDGKPSASSHKAVYAFYRRVKSGDPKRRWVLDTPGLWYVDSLVKMAPHATATEIHRQLTKKADGRAVPVPRTIQDFIRSNRLRTPEEKMHVVSRASASAMRVREENHLSKKVRRNLLFQVYPLLEKWIKATIIPKDEMISLIFERLEHEVKYFDPSKLKSDDPLAVKWKKFVRSRIGFMMIDMIRKKFGRGKKKRKPKVFSMSLDEVAVEPVVVESRAEEWKKLERAAQRDTVGRKIVDLLSRGVSRRRVALMLGISPNTVSVHLMQLRKRVQASA